MATFIELLKRATAFLGNTAVDALIDAHETELMEAEREGRRLQAEDDVFRAVMAFIELKQDDAHIHRLLAKHFNIDSVPEIDKYIHSAKYSIVRGRLKEYCLQNGMSSGDFLFYEKNSGLRNKLLANPKLFDMSADKLKATLDK